MSTLRYALITPARNEAELIEGTLEAVVAQTVRPVRWIVVSDGSTDATDEIVARYTRQYSWIDLLRMPEHRDRTFAAKAACFNAGYQQLARVPFDLIGNLDADITFGPDFYEFLIEQFRKSPRLGVAGCPFIEDPSQPLGHSYAHQHADLSHVSGACQTFRRECFDEVGGYTPIRGGGIDYVAVTTARMKGWETRTFLERTCFHHRPMGTAGRSHVAARFRHGQEDYAVGGHPVWQLLRGAFQMRERPFILGGLALTAGYFWAMAKRVPRPVSPELVAFRRAEQMSRLRRLLGKGVGT